MVDSIRRKKLALHLRFLVTGQITNDEFENSVMDDVTFGWLPEQFYRADGCTTDDPLIRAVVEYTWCLYSDLENHKLVGKFKLTEFQEKEIARMILFLHSNQEYNWDYFDLTNPLMRFSFSEMMRSILTFGKYLNDQKKTRQRQYEEMKSMGDFDYWPFKIKTDFESQLKNPPFLTGENKNH